MADASEGADDADDEAVGECPRVNGRFSALYTPLETNCADLGSIHGVNLSSGAGGATVNVERSMAVDVTTEVVVKGCTLRISHLVANKQGLIRQRIDGEALTIESETRVTGMVTITLFDELGQPSCRGTYQAELTQQSGLLGAG